MFKNTISAILNENANTDDRKKIIRQYCVWSGALYLTGGLLSSTAAVWIISYMNHIHKNINQYVQNNGSTGIVLAMVVFFLMACCLLLVTVTAFVRVTVRLCTFAKPSRVRCAELTITGKCQKSANDIRYSMSQYQVSAKTDKGIIQVDCLSKTYSKVIPGQTCGLFYSLDEKTVKVSLSEK
ncbi:hypothetical protein [Ruminococcus sp.]|uniref:hypothetical protein n=1 Tax=Ruminococcus sp. TaxID=41978 RepID=UPI003AB22228